MILDILQEVLLSWQLRTIFGLVLIDLVLGVAAALRTGDFKWSEIGRFYQSNVLPYLLGYSVFFVTIQFVIPEEGFLNLPAEVADVVNEAVVDVAWGALLLRLGTSILDSFRSLYSGEPT